MDSLRNSLQELDQEAGTAKAAGKTKDASERERESDLGGPPRHKAGHALSIQ
jgi:hypothetical protein